MFRTVVYLTLFQEKIFANNNPEANLCLIKVLKKQKNTVLKLKLH